MSWEWVILLLGISWSIVVIIWVAAWYASKDKENSNENH